MIKHRGLRHLALNVKDVERAVDFYRRVFGMTVVWQPDDDNAYLSSGCDNLALHRGAAGDLSAQSLHHLGFIVATLGELEAGYQWVCENRLEIALPLRRHRDGSVSYYLRDLDGNVIQVLYEPSISPLTIHNVETTAK
jgi:catechol 2,3-dioxygenase-like lactoylglutathione lyase family enzyme